MRKWLPTFATLVFLSVLSPAPAGRAQDPPKEETKEKKPDVAADINKPRADARSISFETSEGTWMSVDVSPDGQTIVFDLLGDLYALPIGGGTAKALTSARRARSAATSGRGTGTPGPGSSSAASRGSKSMR